MKIACTPAPASFLVAIAGAQEAPEPAAEDRSQEFRPVEGGADIASGEVLLVEAYAVFWLAAMALIFSTWRRQKRIDARIDQLKSDLDKAKPDE